MRSTASTLWCAGLAGKSTATRLLGTAATCAALLLLATAGQVPAAGHAQPRNAGPRGPLDPGMLTARWPVQQPLRARPHHRCAFRLVGRARAYLVSGLRRRHGRRDPCVHRGVSWTAWYKGDAPTRIAGYLRTSEGSWRHWTSSRELPASSRWKRAHWTTPAVPTGTARLAFVADRSAKSSRKTPPRKTPSSDTTPPETTITAHPSDPTTATDASFAFASSEPDSTFTCTLDGAIRSCASSQTYSGLNSASHALAVAATDAAGNTDSTPATFNWTVQSPTSTPGSGSYCGLQPPGTPVLSDDSTYTKMRLTTTEYRPENLSYHAYEPTAGEIGYWRAVDGENLWYRNQLANYSSKVTAFPGIDEALGRQPTTTELIRATACKWGLDEDWTFSVIWNESSWYQSYAGDQRTCAVGYDDSRGSTSWGLSQIKGTYPSDANWSCVEGFHGVRPLNRISSRFNLDYYGHLMRACYDGAGPTWLQNPGGDVSGCIGEYFSGGWHDSAADNYFLKIKAIHDSRAWPGA
jgi:hypothetical protein